MSPFHGPHPSLEEPERLPEAVPTTLIIFRRRDFQVFARPLDDAEARALDQVGSGATFGEICEALAASELGLPEAAEKAASYVATWLDDALIRDVHVP